MGVNFLIILVLMLLALGALLFIAVPKLYGAEGILSRITGIDSAESYMEKGNRAYIDGDFNKAIGYYKKLLNKHKDDDKAPLANLKLALCYSAKESFPKSKEVFNDLLSDYSGKLEPETKQSIEDTLLNFEHTGIGDEWVCCDFKQFGCIWTYSVCSEECNRCGIPPEV